MFVVSCKTLNIVCYLVVDGMYQISLYLCYRKQAHLNHIMADSCLCEFIEGMLIKYEVMSYSQCVPF